MNLATTASIDQTHTLPSQGQWRVHYAPSWPSFAGVDWLETIMTIELSDRFHAKQGRSIARWTLINPETSTVKVVYLKRHFEVDVWARLGAKLLPSRSWTPGMQEYEHLQWAANAGIATPVVAAAGEYRANNGRLQSFIAIEELTGMIALHEAIPKAKQSLAAADFQAWKENLWQEVTRLAWELHRQHAYHQDLYLCHFYLAEEETKQLPSDGPCRLVMIDFHRLRHTRMLGLWYQAKDLGQLLFSLDGVEGITPDDVDRILGCYRRHRGGVGWLPWRWLLGIVRRRAANNLATQRRRQSQQAVKQGALPKEARLRDVQA